MLAFLLALSVTAALIVILYINSGGGDDDPQIGDYSSGDAAEEPDIAAINDPGEDDRQWQRALAKPEGSEHWHYYPVIPDDAEPGSTVVLSATSKGFLGWEADPGYADVELTDLSSDAESVQVSFVMPDEEILIRALYDEIPFDNYVPHDDMSVSRADLHEYGEFTTQATIELEPLPDGMVGAQYYARISNAALEEGWHWEIDDDPSFPPPPGLVFTPRTGLLSGVPTTAGSYIFFINLLDAADVFQSSYDFTITILERPMLSPSTVPDGMVDIDYHAGISVDTLPVGTTWVWSATNLPTTSGLRFVADPSDMTQAAIRGTPTKAEAGATYTVKVNLTPADGTFGSSISFDYTIKIWEPPEITTLSGLLDGIVNHGYSKDFAAEGDALAVSTWTWSSADLPSGLGFTTISSGAGRISGEPAAPGKALEFTVRLAADPDILIGYTEKVFTIENIWAPVITTKPSDFPEGMVGPPIPEDEPEENPYYIEIEADGFPSNTTTKWDWDYDGDLPDGLEFMPVEINDQTLSATIEGIPEEHGNFELTVEMTAVDATNPNINGAVISSELITITIWPRTYLHIDISGTDGFVSRPGEEWDETNVAVSNRYKDKRAVMPGTQGIITTIANNGFIRWEVIPGHDTSDQVKIGGPDNYGHREGGRIGFVTIDMPKNPAGPVTPAWDVYILGAHARSPVITATLSRGTIGDLSYASSLSIAQADIGVGPGSLRWDVVNGALPTGLELDATAGRTTSIDVIEGRQIGAPAGDFNFTVGVTLPGTMRVDRPFSITILPVPGVLLGDVNNDGFVDLADLVTLAVFFEDDSIEINEAAADINRNGRVDTGDLTLLARYFARFGILGQ